MSNSQDKARHWFMADAAIFSKHKFRTICDKLGAELPEDVDSILGKIWRLWGYCELHRVRTFENLEELAFAAEVPMRFLEALLDVKWIRLDDHAKPTVRMWQTAAEKRYENKSRASGHIHTHKHTNTPTKEASADTSSPKGSPARRGRRKDAGANTTPNERYVPPDDDDVLPAEEQKARLREIREMMQSTAASSSPA